MTEKEKVFHSFGEGVIKQSLVFADTEQLVLELQRRGSRMLSRVSKTDTFKIGLVKECGESRGLWAGDIENQILRTSDLLLIKYKGLEENNA